MDYYEHGMPRTASDRKLEAAYSMDIQPYTASPGKKLNPRNQGFVPTVPTITQVSQLTPAVASFIPQLPIPIQSTGGQLSLVHHHQPLMPMPVIPQIPTLLSQPISMVPLVYCDSIETVQVHSSSLAVINRQH